MDMELGSEQRSQYNNENLCMFIRNLAVRQVCSVQRFRLFEGIAFWCSSDEQRLPLIAQKEVHNIHCQDTLMIPAGKFIQSQHIFGVVILNRQKIFIFPFFCACAFNLSGCLDIQLLDVDYNK